MNSIYIAVSPAGYDLPRGRLNTGLQLNEFIDCRAEEGLQVRKH